MAEIITTAPERRQIARTMTFPKDVVPYVNWQALGDLRRDLASDMHVVALKDGSLTVEFSWHYSDEELTAESYIVMCRVSGGVTGTREAPLKQNGEVQYFETRDAALAVADRLNAEPTPSHAKFTYWVEKVY